MITTEKVVEQGNFDLFIQKRINDVLTGEVLHVRGLVSFLVTNSQETNEHAADDDPAYFATTSPVTCEGTMTVLSMSPQDQAKLYTSIKDKNGATWFGSNNAADKVGIALKSTITDASGAESTNMVSYPNATITLPEKAMTTIDRDGGELTNVPINFTAGPVFWEDAEGVRRRATYGIINSKENAAVWDKLKDKVFTPDMVVV